MRRNEPNPYSGSVKEPYTCTAYKPTRRRRFGPRKTEANRLNDLIRKDPAHRKYLAVVGQRRRNNGLVSKCTQSLAASAPRRFLTFLNRPITETALSELIEETRRQHRSDDFTTDDALLQFVNQKEVITYAQLGSAIKGIFKANRCPLQVSFNTTFTKSTRKISTGILKAIYQSLPRNERRLIIDLQAYAGERVAAICRNTGLDQWEDYGASA